VYQGDQDGVKGVYYIGEDRSLINGFLSMIMRGVILVKKEDLAIQKLAQKAGYFSFRRPFKTGWC